MNREFSSEFGVCGLNGNPLKRNVHGLIPRHRVCYLIWKKDICRCNFVQDLELRLSWITCVDPKSNECPYERQGQNKNMKSRRHMSKIESQRMPAATKEEQGRVRSRAFRGGEALLSSCFWTSGLNCETMFLLF